MNATCRRSMTMSSPGLKSRSTASLTRSTVARSISPSGATMRAPSVRWVAMSKLPGAATSPGPSLHLLTHSGSPLVGIFSARATRIDEALSNGGGLLALEVDRRIHPAHHVRSQTSTELVERPGELRAVLPCQVAADHRREVLERKEVARVAKHGVAAGRQLALGREDREHVDLAPVEARIAGRELQRNELEAIDAVERLHALGAFEAGLELRQGTELEALDLRQVGDRAQVVLRGEARQHRKRVGVGERRRGQQREAALLLERLRPVVRARGGRGARTIARDLREQHPGVLRIHVETARGQGLVDDLGATDVALQHDLEAGLAQRSGVQLAEDVLLGEVLRADRDRRQLRFVGLVGLAATAARDHDGCKQRDAAE